MTKPIHICITLAVLLAAAAAPAIARDIRVAQSFDGCDPNYDSDTCVPIASDVDCAGGSGNGPEYVRGPFRYRGYDVYDLDRDNDGIACE